MNVHVPSIPPDLAALHASHVPSQAVSQQTLSTQWVLMH